MKKGKYPEYESHKLVHGLVKMLQQTELTEYMCMNVVKIQKDTCHNNLDKSKR